MAIAFIRFRLIFSAVGLRLKINSVCLFTPHQYVFGFLPFRAEGPINFLYMHKALIVLLGNFVIADISKKLCDAAGKRCILI